MTDKLLQCYKSYKCEPAGDSSGCNDCNSFNERLDVRLGLGKADYLGAFLPLTALLQQFHALETLQNVAFCSNGACAFETTMLRHRGCFLRK